MNSNELAKADAKITRSEYEATRTGAILPQTIMEAITLAKVLYESALFPSIGNAKQAVAMILAGAELGVPPIAALSSFHIVKGKIMLHYALIGQRVRAAGYDYRVIDHTDDICSIEFFSKHGESIGTSEFTAEDAKKAQTQNMSTKPRVMLFARAMSQGARFFVPEAFNGLIVYSEEEREEIEGEEAETPQPKGTSQAIAEKLMDAEVPPEYNPFEDHEDTYTGPTVRDEVEA